MLPVEFSDRIKKQFPQDGEQLLKSIDLPPITSIRLNPRKNLNLSKGNIPWTKYGFYVVERPRFTYDPSFHAGAYYVQESSSMFVEHILKYIRTKISLNQVLDLCAAPGGKSTIVLDQLEPHQFLLSNEILPQRNLILRENLTKWGYPNFIITENKPKDFKKLRGFFDCILLDAPCSGEGLFRRDKRAIDEWSLSNAKMCSERQEEIFEHVWDSLKEGGYMIYSTCTFNPDENEVFLQRMKRKGYEFDCEALSVDEEWNIDIVSHQDIIGYRFLPHKVKGEGFYCSIIRKKGDWFSSPVSNSKSYINPWLNEYLNVNDLKDYSTYKFKNSLFLAPNALLDQLPLIQSSLYVKQIGIEVGNYDQQKIVPHHGLSMLSFKSKLENRIEFSEEQAIEYLSHNDINIELSEGFWFVTFRNNLLGWLLVSKSKVENLYPAAWKIRK